MTPRDNSRSRRPAEHREPRAASPALDRAVPRPTAHRRAAKSFPRTAPPAVPQLWHPRFGDRGRLAVCFSLTNQSPSVAPDYISNRHIPRLETYLTPAKSTRGPILIATKRDMHFSPLGLAFLPSKDGGEPSRCRRESTLDDILADFAARISNAEYLGERRASHGAP